MALKTITGLDLFKWFHRVDELHPTPAPPGHPLFQVPGERAMDSLHYRTRFLYPALEFLRATGDPLLKAFGPDRGSSLPERFYSLHSYRRGARTHCQCSCRTPGHKKAAPTQVYEHARWRLKRSNQPIDQQYREWTLYERLRITLFCH